ncbi:MAG: hypothetical protein KDA63_05165 [Planctomycetales bacterium]|nr:hypothetical protein [Planctomycetales bacterium]
MTVGRFLLATILAAVVLLVLWAWQLLRPSPPIRLSRQTTYITAPLADDGLPDYVAYLNDKYGEGVTPENNATVLLVRATGLPDVQGEQRARWFDALGMEPLPEDGEYLTSLFDQAPLERTSNWLVAYWRSQQDGSKPPTSMAGLNEFSQPIDRDMERRREFAAKYRPRGDMPLMRSIPYGEDGEYDWMQATEEVARELHRRAMARPWQSSRLPSMDEWLNENRGYLDKVVEASKKPKMHAPLFSDEQYQGPDLVGVDITIVQDVNDACRVLCARAMNRVAEGRYEEAFEDTMAVHGLARLEGSGPTVVHYLVGLARDGIACELVLALAADEDVSELMLRKALRDVSGLERWKGMADQFDEAERLAALDTALTLYRDPSLSGLGGRKESSTVSRLAASSVDWNFVLSRINGEYDDLADASRNPGDEQRQQKLVENEEARDEAAKMTPGRAAWCAISRQARSAWIANTVLRLMMPASHAALTAEVRANVSLDLATTALALALYRACHGEYPETLDLLVPEIMDDVPVDAFADGPLHYERRGEGYLLYSIGQDRRDDGATNWSTRMRDGEWMSIEDYEAGGTDGDDLVVRVPMPALVIPSLPEGVVLPAVESDGGTSDANAPVSDRID